LGPYLALHLFPGKNQSNKWLLQQKVQTLVETPMRMACISWISLMFDGAAASLPFSGFFYENGIQLPPSLKD